MRWSLSISSLVHAAILVSAVIALPDPEEFETKTSEAVPVEILSEEDLPTPQVPEKPPEKIKEPEPPKPKPPKEVAALPPKPEPEPVPVEKPPEKAPVEEKAPEPEPEPIPEKVAEPVKQVEKSYPLPQPKPKVPKRPKQPEPKRFDDTIDALLNKLPDETPPPQPETDEEPEPATETASATDYFQSGTRLERDQIAAIINAKMSQCWTPPAGLQDAHNLKVTFRLSFKSNGEFASRPINQTTVSDALTRAAVESAQRALIRCAPYVLPQDTYDIWKDMVLNFSPASMF